MSKGKFEFFETADSKMGIWQPGNGTRYVCVASRVPPDANELGYSGWVISFPEFGAAYWLRVGGYVDLSYMSEKWGMTRTGSRLNQVDLSEMGRLICLMFPGTQCELATDEHGLWSEKRSTFSLS